MLEKKFYLAAAKAAAERVFGKVQDALKSATERVKNLIEQPSVIGRESNTLYEGMRFVLPSTELIESGDCFILQTYEGNEYVALLVECGGRVVPIAKGRFAREPRKVDSDGKLIREGNGFATYQLEGTFFEVYRNGGKTFKEAILACAKICEENDFQVVVGKPKSVTTTAYKGDNSTAEVMIYPMDFCRANGQKVARNRLGLS